MTVSSSALEDVVDRIRDQLGDVESRRAVELRTVEPLLEALGWDVRSPDVEPGVGVAGHRVDYLLSVDGTPAVAVRTAAPGASLEEHESALRAVLASGGVGWGLLSDGARYVLLARDGDEVHRQQLALPDLPDATDALSHYSYDAASSYVASRSADRSAARERLAAEREAAVEAVTDALVSIAGEAMAEPARAGAAQLVDELAADEGSAGDTAGAAGGSAGSSDAADDAADAATPDDADAAADPPASRRGEYVVRFFGGSASVGAVGTETPGGTLAGVVAFLQENHDLGGAVQLPWGVTDDRARLAPSPEHPDGTPMERFDVVDGDCYVWTGGSVERVRQTIEELADVVDLRVMFQGDW